MKRGGWTMYNLLRIAGGGPGALFALFRLLLRGFR